MEDIYKEYIVYGGHVYPQKPTNPKGCSGDGRVVLKWKKGSRFFDCKKQLFLGMMVGKIENLTFLETRKM